MLLFFCCKQACLSRRIHGLLKLLLHLLQCLALLGRTSRHRAGGG